MTRTAKKAPKKSKKKECPACGLRNHRGECKPSGAKPAPRARPPEPVDQLAAIRDEVRDEWLASEEAYLARVFREAEWGLNGAARIVGCSVSTLQGALERHPRIEAERQRSLAGATRAA